MPSTPFHLPPSLVVAWPARHHLDVPAFLLANFAVDVEPVVVLVAGLDRPPHGLSHTLLGAALLGAVTGWLLWLASGRLGRLLGGSYDLTRRSAVSSGVAGALLHVLIDALMHADQQPFLPVEGNPLLLSGSGPVLHLVGAVAFVAAVVLVVRDRAWRTVPERLTVVLLAVSLLGMAGAAALGLV
ncbi:metal-dependent hydrolase [Egicoccus halophilus]|nr:metal-dependent hydrolase [Egicoccus halophilus]